MCTVLKYITFLSVLCSTYSYSALQLPFPDGKGYECMQNSDDFPSHGRDENNIDIPAKSTKYDLDFAMKTGDIVTAANSGTVTITGNDCKEGTKTCNGGFGKMIKVSFENGDFTIYAHLDNFLVIQNQNVTSGQPIGRAGNTGNSTGTHVHFGLHKGTGVGESIPMEVYALDTDSGEIDTFHTALKGNLDRDFVCANPDGKNTRGHLYQSRPINTLFSTFQCIGLDNGNGVLCWSGHDNHFEFCDDGINHVRYYKDKTGYQVETFKSAPNYCFEAITQNVDLALYLDGNHVGGGSPITSPSPKPINGKSVDLNGDFDIEDKDGHEISASSDTYIPKTVEVGDDILLILQTRGAERRYKL